MTIQNQILQSILKQIDLCQNRFTNIFDPNDFVSTWQGNLLFDAIVFRLQTSVLGLSELIEINPLVLNEHSLVQWDKILALRNFIYEELDYKIVFEICKVHLPPLKSAIQKELDDLSQDK